MGHCKSEDLGDGLGFVLLGCGENPQHTRFLDVSKNPFAIVRIVANYFAVFFASGIFLQAVFFVIIQGLFFNANIKWITTKINDETYRCYGLFWSFATVALLCNMCLLFYNGTLIKSQILSNESTLMTIGYSQIIFTLFIMILELPVSIVSGMRLNLPIPATFIVCVRLLFCFKCKKGSQKLIQIAAMINVSIFLQNFLCYAACILMAFLSNPPRVIASSLVYIFGVFCAVHFLAVFFTFGKLNSQRQRKRNLFCKLFCGTAQIAAFTILFVSALCFGFIIGASGAMSSYGSHTKGPIPTLSAIITPILFAVLGYLLKKGGSHWLKSYDHSDIEVSESSPLVNHSKCLHKKMLASQLDQCDISEFEKIS